MGFRSRGFDSNWQDRWPSGGGGGGGGGSRVSGGGFRDHSPDFEEAREANSDIDEFKDDEDFDSISNRSNNASSSVARAKPSPVSTPDSSAVQNKPAKVTKSRKPIDLGAAATYAAQQQGVPKTTTASSTAAQANTVSNNDLIGDLLEDQQSNFADFNPRGGASTVDANANGNFGDFAGAFGGDATTADNSKRGGDEFADFSSAFSTNDNNKATTGLNAPSVPSPPSPQNVPDSFDLLGGGNVGTANTLGSQQTNSLDLLGGLDLGVPSAMPPLIQQNSMSGSGFNQQPAGLIAVSPASLPPNLVQPSVNKDIPLANNNNSKKAPPTATAIPERWGNVGTLNIDLDNLSLSGRNQKKAAVPMNAMKSSSSDSPVSPMGQQLPGQFINQAQQPPPPGNNASTFIPQNSLL